MLRREFLSEFALPAALVGAGLGLLVAQEQLGGKQGSALAAQLWPAAIDERMTTWTSEFHFVARRAET